MTYTDTQLKQTLAKMLPKELCFAGDGILYHCQHKDGIYNGYSPAVLDTELLHLCRLVEEVLNDKEFDKYLTLLHISEGLTKGHVLRLISATWQQRTPALAKVKGIEIV